MNRNAKPTTIPSAKNANPALVAAPSSAESGEQFPGAHDVWEAQECAQEGADDESDLDGHRQPPHACG